MKALILPLAALGTLAAMSAAEAASPAYCALYAREYANQFSSAIGKPDGSESRIQDEAYYRCLNQDENPEMPTTSAYVGIEAGDEAVTGEGDASPADEIVPDEAAKTVPTEKVTPQPEAKPAASEPAKQTAEKKGATKTGRGYTSGAEFGSAEWLAWCKKNFPNSFDEKDGTIFPFGATSRQKCK